jgi:hypothetical protein
MATSTEPSSNKSTSSSRLDGPSDPLAQLKRQLLRAEVRLAKARAHAAGAEADVKVLSAQLKAVSK